MFDILYFMYFPSLLFLSYVWRFDCYTRVCFLGFFLQFFLEAKSGLSEAELEDILSCDDDVLNDVYMYWTPPIRRLPPLLLVRLKASLEDKHYLGMTEISYWVWKRDISQNCTIPIVTIISSSEAWGWRCYCHVLVSQAILWGRLRTLLRSLTEPHHSRRNSRLLQRNLGTR